MDPRAVELSDIVKLYDTEEDLLNTAIVREDLILISKDPFRIYTRRDDGTFVRFADELFLETLYSKNGEIALEFTGEGDDKGISLKGGQLAIEDGELIAGKDSYPVPIAFHCNEANTIGKVITDAVNVTKILQSDALSSVGLFDGTSAGNYILVGAPATFEGAKIKYDTLASVEPDNIVAEFYTDSVGDWSSVPFMATNSNFPYIETSNHIAQVLSEQIFFGFNPLIRDQESIWEESTFTINGEELTYYWARFRIISAITGDPQVQQIKLHTDRIEFESQGIFKYGRARNPVSLPFIQVKNDLSDPVNEKVTYTPNYVADFIDNELVDNATDGFGVIVNRIFGLDTSVPVVVDLSFYVKGSNTGDIVFTYEVSQIVDGFVYDGTEPYDSYEKIVSITETQNNERFSVKLVVLINKLTANSAIVVNVVRNGSDVRDTLPDHIVRTNIACYGYIWKI